MRKATRMQAIVRTLAAAAAVSTLLRASPASAISGTFRSWVAKTGSDTANNTCAITAPCRTLQHAHDVTVGGGEVSVLTPGDYGPLTVNRAIAVANDGVGEANTTAILIEAGSGDTVGLRGLIIDGLGGGGVGIALAKGAALHVQNCVIRNFNGNSAIGINMETMSHSKVFVSDTLVVNNGSGVANGATGGILVFAGAGASADVVLNRVRLENNDSGLVVSTSVDSFLGVGPSRVVVRDSVISGNANHGIWATAGEVPAFIFVHRSSSVGNGGTGVLAEGAGATVLIGKDTVARNGTGIAAQTGGQIISYSDNEIDNNVGADGAPTALISPR